MASKRPKLRRVDLGAVLPPRPGVAYATVGPGQWDLLLQHLYEQGLVVLEVDSRERVVAAYCKNGAAVGPVASRN